MFRWIVWFCWGCLLAICAHAAEPQTYSVCADPDPPPWTYWKRDAEGRKGREFIGSSVDTLRAAFAAIGKTVEFHGEYPWARCLAMVEGGQIDFAMDAYYDTARARRFAYSSHYNTLTPQLFFRANKPLKVANVMDLKNYVGCGMIGASYVHYGLAAEDLDLGSGYDGLIKKLKAQRCDYFVEELEVIAGYQFIGTDYLADPEIRHGPVPGAKAPAKHLIAAKNSPGASLLPRLDAALAGLVKSGEAARIWKQHAGNLPYTP
ncbi:MAG: transporter substrate-binding domain-containing protein [Rhodoferax sp.]|nr:transporter substrate-binding domain-containing protein [Rhodoferax sp.]